MYFFWYYRILNSREVMAIKLYLPFLLMQNILTKTYMILVSLLPKIFLVTIPVTILLPKIFLVTIYFACIIWNITYIFPKK